MSPEKSSTKSPIEQFRTMKPDDRLTLTKSEIQSIIGSFNNDPAEEPAIQRFIPASETPPFNPGAVLNAVSESLRKNDPAIADRLRRPESEPKVLGWYDLTDSAYGELHQVGSPKPNFALGPRKAGIVVKIRRPEIVNGQEKSPVFIAYLPPDKAMLAGIQSEDVESVGHAYRIGHKAPHDARMLEVGDGSQNTQQAVNVYQTPRQSVTPSPVTPDGRYNGARPGGEKKAHQVREPVIVPPTAAGGD